MNCRYEYTNTRAKEKLERLTQKSSQFENDYMRKVIKARENTRTTLVDKLVEKKNLLQEEASNLLANPKILGYKGLPIEYIKDIFDKKLQNLEKSQMRTYQEVQKYLGFATWNSHKTLEREIQNFSDLVSDLKVHVQGDAASSIILRRIDSELDSPRLDAAIIGAGLSGLYTGWRLRTGDYNNSRKRLSNVHIFEMSGRVGGRLESVTLPGMKIMGELGGMHYHRPQKIITTLVEEVFKNDLRNVDFPEGNQYYYLRGQRFPANSWSEAQKRGEKFETRYFLNEQDAGYSPEQLCNKIAYEVLMADPQVKQNYGNKMILNPENQYDYRFELTAQDWNEIRPTLRYNFPGSPYHNQLVKDMGYQNLIIDRVGKEGYNFLTDACGRDSYTVNANAAEVLSYIAGNFSKGDASYRTIEGGYDKIAYTLAKEFLSSSKAQGDSALIWTDNRLVGFEKKGDRYRLRIFNQRKGKEWAAYTDAIVLAMPRRSLELLMQNQHTFFFDSAKLRENIRSVILEPAYKLLMGFKKPWWKEKFGIQAGRSITDLPLRQSYYFGTDPDNQHSVFLASYNEMDSVKFWSSLERESNSQQEKHEKESNQQELSMEAMEVRAVQAPQTLVKEAMRQVRELHGDDSIPDPYIAYSKDWSQDPFGAGFTGWEPGVDVGDVMRFMRRPNSNEKIHIVGDNYSDEPGWGNAAFAVAEKMLQEHFDLKWPDWLDQDYHLGR